MKDFHVDGLRITALTDEAKTRITYHIFASDKSLAEKHGFSYETNALNIPLITKGMEFEWVNQPKEEPRKKPEDKRPFWVRKMVKDFTLWEKLNWHLNPFLGMPKPYTFRKVLVRLHNDFRFFVIHWLLNHKKYFFDKGPSPCFWPFFKKRKELAAKSEFLYAIMWCDFRYYTARWPHL